MMNEIIMNVPDRIRYLSELQELWAFILFMEY